MKSSSALSKSAKADSQPAKADDGLGLRLQEAAALKGWTQKKLSEVSGVPSARVNDYWNGKKNATTPNLFALADALDVSAKWLALGRGPRGDRLIDAANADWIEVEDFDLRQFDDRGKGEPVGRTMFRRDWLYLTLGESSGLWTTRTLAPDMAHALPAGAAIVCKDHPSGEPPLEGQNYLFRVDGSIVLSRFSYRLGSLGSIGDRVEERIITPADLNAGEHQFFIVARVLGALVRPF